ncbi:MAG: HAD hydrolase-like protein [Actinomycetes bacterium]
MTSPRYEVVLLDLDGTVIDSLPGIAVSVRHGLEAIGFEEITDEVIMKFMGPPLKDVLVDHFGRPESDIDGFFAAYKEMYFDDAEYDFELYPGLGRLIEDLNAAGVMLILATAKPDVSAERILRHAKLDHLFAIVAGSHEDGSRQVKTDVLAHAFELASIDHTGTSIVMVGDRDTDIVAAEHFGIDSIAITYGYAPAGELEALSPTFYAANADELRAILLPE